MKELFTSNSKVTNLLTVTIFSICIIVSSGMILTKFCQFLLSSKTQIDSEASATLVNIVDSRFKHLAASFQHQIDELKLQVVPIDSSGPNHVHQAIVNNNQHEINKRQVVLNKGSNIERPLTGRANFCATGSSPCTFYYADSPDSGRTRLKIDAKISTKTLPICESSSSLCNFYHQDHPNVTVTPRPQNNTTHSTNETGISNNTTTSMPHKTTPTYVPISSTISVEKCVPCVSNNLKVDERIHFYASVSNNKTVLLQDLDVIKFDELLLNIGKAFDINNGVFTASKSGVYQFVIQGTFTLTSYVESLYFYITILKNDCEIDYIIFTHNNNYSPRSLVVAFKLSQGDKIHLKYFKSEQNKKFENIVSLYSFIFSGSLLNAN